MYKDNTKVVVFDLELTCEESAPEGYEPEIIQVGLCYLELPSLEITGKTQFLLRPPTQSISDFCVELTGIQRREILKLGVDFRVALKWMTEKYGFRRYISSAWGDDRSAIVNQCRKFGFPELYDDKHGEFFDIATLASVKGLGKRPGLGEAMKALGLKFEGRPHAADDDAYNAARVLRELLSPLHMLASGPPP
jgi:inhibitor of KinA sporulation pathway (predicted exonuclease)